MQYKEPIDITLLDEKFSTTQILDFIDIIIDLCRISTVLDAIGCYKVLESYETLEHVEEYRMMLKELINSAKKV
jgi:hypothetical protein